MSNQRSIFLVYKLGEGYPIHNGQPLYAWPYRVDYLPDYPNGVFYLSEGDTRNGNGSFFAAHQVLGSRWRDHVATAGVLWLVPLLERIAHGEDVDREEILKAYQQVHGTLPPTETWWLST